MAFKFSAREAIRENVFVKIALVSPSGGGKTYSSLRLATGMANEIETQTGKRPKILFANSEYWRGIYYANEFKYDIVDLEPPYEPEMYVDLIQYAVDNNYGILIIDGTSPEWEGKGGCLEILQKAGGKYQDWKYVTPRHDKFILAMANSPIHIISTMRGKDQYEIEKDERGKNSVKKLAVGAKQREGFEYEFTCSFLMDKDTHLASRQKDNTHLFEDDLTFLLTEDCGEKIIKWATSGKAYTPRVFKTKEEEENVIDEEKLNDRISQIDSLVSQLKELGVESEIIADCVKKYFSVKGKPVANYKKISSIEVADLVIEELKSVIQ